MQTRSFMAAVADLEHSRVVASGVEGFRQTVERDHRDVLDTGPLAQPQSLASQRNRFRASGEPGHPCLQLSHQGRRN
jgi:hypothetical protein